MAPGAAPGRSRPPPAKRCSPGSRPGAGGGGVTAPPPYFHAVKQAPRAPEAGLKVQPWGVQEPRLGLGPRGPAGIWGSLLGGGPSAPPPPFPLQPAAPGCPLAPAPAPGVINGPWELIPGQLGLPEPPRHLGRAALFHLVIYRDGPFPPSAPCSGQQAKSPSLQSCPALGLSSMGVPGTVHPSPRDKSVPGTSSVLP